MQNNSSGDGVAIILDKPIGGNREAKFKDGKRLAQWLWANKPDIFTSVPKSEQRD